MWYFAYGANMDRQRLELHRAIKVLEVRLGVLENYRLVFNKVSSIRPSTGCANIIPAEGQRVLGVLYRIAELDITKLDIFEGVSSGQYHRERVLVKAEENDLVEAEVYIADETRNDLEPSIEYLESVLKGARESGIDEDYIEENILVHHAGEDTG
jgi:cation transport regulator ChaC